jgi:hypothetical protein
MEESPTEIAIAMLLFSEGGAAPSPCANTAPSEAIKDNITRKGNSLLTLILDHAL